MVPGFESEDDDEFSDDDLTKEKNNGSFLGVKSLGKDYSVRKENWHFFKKTIFVS